MFPRRSSTFKYILAATLGILLYCEWAVYLAEPFFWKELKCNPNDQSCTKILFIADPQIQGDEAVPPPLNYLFNWDSDRYLRATFTEVVKYFKPDILVYMGDLMDEGSIATMEQFHAYVKRLANIFNIDYPVVQIWIPGDNDIGGEGEPIRQNKVEEFEKVFNQPHVISYRNISFYKVNGIMHKFPKEKMEYLDLKIVISHYPVTIKHSFGELVNNAIRPNIYFCAHEHESKYVKQTKQLTFRETVPLRREILKISFVGDTLYEIYVPTCSYRMGTSKIGFGAAILEKENEVMRYTVFWSPQRFPYLFLYLLLLIFIVTYLFIFCIARLLYKRPNLKKLGTANETEPFLERI